MTDHINLKASSLGRSVACPGSVSLAAQSPEQPKSDDAMEGDAAHEAAYRILTGDVQLASELVDRKASNDVYMTVEMIEAIEPYVMHVTGWRKFEKPLGFYIADNVKVKGTADAQNWDEATGVLSVADLKYGYRIVEPQDNWQLFAYAWGLGATDERVQRVDMTIVQPRPYHPDGPVRTWSLTRDDMIAYFYQLQDVAKRLEAGDTSLQTGEHCRYCPALASCPAARAASFNAIDVAMNSGTLDPDDPAGIGAQLDVLERAAEVIKLRREALEEATIARGGVPGWGVAPSVGNRAWLDMWTPELVKMTTGVDCTETKLCTPAQAEKRGVSGEVLETMTHRPQRGFKVQHLRGDEAAKAFGGGS
jgi:hypothetical protein